MLPERSHVSAHRSIFAGGLAAPCQGSLPQIELLEGPAGSSGFSGSSSHVTWLTSPSLQEEYLESLCCAVTAGPSEALSRGTSFGVVAAWPEASALASGMPAAAPGNGGLGRVPMYTPNCKLSPR